MKMTLIDKTYLGLAEKVVKVDKDWVGDVKKLKQMHKKPIK
jgi:hypothetical protein